MSKSKWKVGITKSYIAFRVIDESQPTQEGNIEHYGEYSENREEIEKLAEELNAREGCKEWQLKAK